MKENYEFNANELYEDSYQNAERMLEDPGKIDRLLKRLEKTTKISSKSTLSLNHNTGRSQQMDTARSRSSKT